MKQNRTVLILGAGIMQIPALQISKELGWRVIAADGNPAAPGVPLADIFLHVDLKEKEQLAEAVRGLQGESPDGVFTAGTDFTTTVAWIAETFGLPGIPYLIAKNARDKVLMRRVFTSRGVPSPGFIEVKKGTDISTAEILGFPVVVKPVDNMGARGVRKVEDVKDLSGAVQEALSFSLSGTAIVEEYIEGPEFSLDAVVYKGQITICGFADRHICFEPYFIEMGHTIPSAYPPDVRRQITDVFMEGVNALGITDGAAKGDVKLGPDGPVIGEIAARLSGGYMSGWTYPYSSGVEVTAAALRIAAGLDPGNAAPLRSWVSAERAFISIPGIIGHVGGLRQARQVPFVKDLFLRVKEGDRVDFPRNNVEKCGNIISQAETREAAVSAAEEAVRRIILRLKSGEDSTFNFLRKKSTLWVPDAYTLGSGENIQALREMPLYIDEKPETDWKLPVLPLPAIEKETEKDWHGLPFADAWRIILREVPDMPVIPGRIFWEAFLRGGVQGALWVVDTIKEKSGNVMDMRSFLQRWED